ncbi:insulinase family protein [Streptomyces sp. NP160]|uniref:insulinase family protein n=1 Tax=Streptomyces sp. NP160 TaxID=2586637 RepID=UPI00111B2C74|nr:insulinase family protein [Streptomyces sp. NP160]TNM69688.1 insulinase family protein [Streptomyces sp. NP160]
MSAEQVDLQHEERAVLRDGLQTGLQELVVDGVRVFHRPGPSKTRASLVFDVGLRDESFETVGLTHLVQHLVWAQLPRTRCEVDVTVAVDHTEFSAYGRPDEVGDVLRRVCTALADLPLDRLEREKSALVADGTVGADMTMAVSWAARYGFDGPGLALTDGLGPLVLTGEEALAHAAERFHAGRAALGVLGPLPEGLSLPLRADGTAPRAPRRHPRPRLGDGPEWVQAPTEGVGLLLDGLEPYDAAADVARTVLCERLQDVARTGHGLTYSVSSDLLDGVDGDVFTVALDVREGMGAEVAGLVWEQLADLATNGPTPAELDHALTGSAAELDASDDDVADAEPFRTAFHTALYGRVRTLEEVSAGLAGVTREAVRDRLAAAARRALLVVPDGFRVPDAALQAAPIAERSWCAVAPALPPGRQHRPPLLDRLRSKLARRRLVVTEECIALQDETGAVHVVRWDEVAGVDELPYSEGGLGIVGRHLCGLPVHPDAYGREAFDEVLRRLAPQVERLRQAQRARELAAPAQHAEAGDGAA